MWSPLTIAIVAVVVVTLLAVLQRRRLGSLCVRTAGWLGKHSQLLRRLGAAIFFLAALTLTLVSSFTSYLQTCADQVVRVGNVPTVRTCGPMSIDTPPVLILIIAAGVCLLPEWNVFEIPGFLRVERKIEEQGKKVEEQGRRQDEIVRILQQVQQTQNLSVSLNQSINGLTATTDVFKGIPNEPEGDRQ